MSANEHFLLRNLPMANARMNGRRRPHRHLHVSLHMPIIGWRKKPRIGLINQANEKNLKKIKSKWISSFKTTYVSSTRNKLNIGIVKAVSTAYIYSIAKKKNTRRRIIQKLFRGGPTTGNKFDYSTFSFILKQKNTRLPTLIDSQVWIAADRINRTIVNHLIHFFFPSLSFYDRYTRLIPCSWESLRQ